MSDVSTHIAQFKLHFYKGDSIIKSEEDLNRYQCIYCPEDDKIYKHKFYFDKEPEPFLKEIGDYSDESGDCEKDYFYFYAPKDIFFIEYLHEIGDFNYDDTSTNIIRWVDEMFNEGDVENYSMIKKIYDDVKEDINTHLEKRPNVCKFIFDRLLHLQSHSFTTGYEYVEYECNISYIGLFKLNKPETLSPEEIFEKEHGMSSKEFYKNLIY